MLFLTVAYDWLLFGHQRKERVARREHIFEFCYDFLQYIEGPEYSLDAIVSESNGDGGAAAMSPAAAAAAPQTPVTSNGGTPHSASSAVSPNGRSKARPIAVRKISDASSSNASVGSPGAASSWQLLERGTRLSVSSFDDNLVSELDRGAERASRRAKRLHALRRRFFFFHSQHSPGNGASETSDASKLLSPLKSMMRFLS